MTPQPTDNLKYRIACFLIENMPTIHIYHKGELPERRLTCYRWLAANDNSQNDCRLRTAPVGNIQHRFADTIQKHRDTADSLAYKDVPTNVLLLLRNHSRGNQERIFTYEEGKAGLDIIVFELVSS